MSAATDVLLDRLSDAEQARDAALAKLDAATELLEDYAAAAELLERHRADLQFVHELRHQLDALGITPDTLTDRVQRLSGGPVGKLLGIGSNGDRSTLVD